MEHPNEEQRKRQAQFLANCPVNEKEFHARLFRLGNATYIYHQRASEFEPTKNDFKEWLEELPANIAKDMEKRGFEDCKGVLSFTRYVNEKNDVGMGEWLKKHLSKEDYNAYCDTIKEVSK